MRPALALLAAVLLSAATPPGCGAERSASQAPSGPPYGTAWEAACEGLPCGASCGYCPPGTDPSRCPVPTFAPTACNLRGQCVTAGTFLCEGQTCAGQGCGIDCSGACPYGAPCAAPVVCDGLGGCGQAPATCVGPEITACAGKACGADCVVDPPCLKYGCMLPSYAGHCDAGLACVKLDQPITCP